MGWFNKKSDHWTRTTGSIATRIESKDVKSRLGNKPFVVYDGTAALIFERGRLLGKLNSGKHDIDGAIRRYLAGDKPTVLVIVDDGDILLDLDVHSLVSEEDISLDMHLRLTVRLGDTEAFYRNVLKDKAEYHRDELSGHLRAELHDALMAFTSVKPIEALYHEPHLREQAIEQIRSRTGESLSRMGLELIAINVVQVRSVAYDAHRGKKSGVVMEGSDAAVKAARLAVLRRTREDQAGDARHKIGTQSDLRDALRQSVHELGLKDTLRSDEMARLESRLEQDALDFTQERREDRERASVDHDSQIDAAKRAHEREQADLALTTFLDQRIQTAGVDAEVRDVERCGDEKDWDLARKMRDDALEAKRKKGLQDVEIESERIASVSKADTATKVALGLGDAEALVELERLAQQKSLSPDQMLIAAAEKSGAAAAALAERYKAEGRLSEDVLEQMRKQLEHQRQSDCEHADRLEKVLQQALSQMGRVAEAKAESQGPGNQTVIAPGSGGATVVNPNANDARPKGDGS